MTVFLGCGFAAKYREGGGNFSVPLQWMLGLRRLKLDAIWLELLPARMMSWLTSQRLGISRGNCGRMGWPDDIVCSTRSRQRILHDLDSLQCIGVSKRELLERLGGPNVMLNLAYSIHPPLLLKFERRIFCDLDPSEIFYWMTKMEVGQSYHHEFWTIGLNVHGDDCRLPKSTCRPQGCGYMENILSARGHEIVSATIAFTLTEIHNCRAMVLGRGGGGRRRISRFIEKIRLRTLSKSSSARARGAV